MKIKISEANKLILDYLKMIGMDSHDASVLTEIILEQEMIGNQFSPIGELASKHSQFIDSSGTNSEEIVVDKPSVQLVKGNGRMAALITADHLDDIIQKAKIQGIYAFGIYDSTYNEFFDVFCRRIVAQDCVAIIVENGGPQGVVPFGGKKDITGTNPIAYGIPTHKNPIVFDAATAMHAYGRIRQAKEKNELLPENAYIDKDGNITTDPNIAHAILPFGGFKGFAINLLIDVLSGALVRGKCGMDQPQDSQKYIGTLIIVIDPAAFGEINIFKDSTTKLVEDILAVPSIDPARPVKVPGIRGSLRLEQCKQQGFLEIGDHDWKNFLTILNKLSEEKLSNNI